MFLTSIFMLSTDSCIMLIVLCLKDRAEIGSSTVTLKAADTFLSLMGESPAFIEYSGWLSWVVLRLLTDQCFSDRPGLHGCSWIPFHSDGVSIILQFKTNQMLLVAYTWLADVNASVAKCLHF